MAGFFIFFMFYKWGVDPNHLLLIVIGGSLTEGVAGSVCCGANGVSKISLHSYKRNKFCQG